MRIYSPSHFERYKGEKVCAIDLDDVLSLSITSWIGFIKKVIRMGKISTTIEPIQEFIDLCKEGKLLENWMESGDLIDMKKSIPYYYYRILKEQYRNSDTKKYLPLREGANYFVDWLKEKGYVIIVLTARGERSLLITVDWLKNNGIKFDGIIFDKNKHVRVLEEIPDLSFMIEDNRDIANMVGKWGYKVYLLDNAYNYGKLHENVKRIFYPRYFDHIKFDLENKNEKETLTNND